ncbi:MAG: tetratricopeptide repeat protein [Candidatus Hodarchaeales archaeon]|jgi:tetratricopeptide (TPR) repeat protein
MSNPVDQIENRLKKGQSFKLLAKYDKALELFAEVNKLTSDSNVKNDVLNEMGEIFFDRGDYNEALSLFQKSLEIASHTYYEGRLKSNLNVARVYYEWSQYKLALNILEECLELQKQTNNEKGRIDVTNSMIKVYWRTGNYVLALDLAKQTERMSREQGYQKGEDDSLNAQANIFLRRGDLDKSLILYNKSLAIRKSLKDQINISNTYNSLAIFYRIKGDLYLSFDYANRALEIKKQIADKRGIGISLHELGDIYLARGEFKEALKSYRKSLEIKEEIDDKFGIARTNSNIGEVYYTMGEFDEALIYYTESLKLRDGMNEKRGSANCYQQIGKIYDDRGQKEAIDFFNKSLAIYSEIKDNKGMAELLSDIGTLLHSKGYVKKSIETFKNAMDLYEDIDLEEGLVDALCEYASALIDANKLEQASTQLERAAKLAMKHGSKLEEQLVLTYQAILKKAQKDLGTAKNQLLRIYNESKVSGIAKAHLLSCLNLASIYLEEFKLDFGDTAFNETQRYIEEAERLTKEKMLIPYYINTLLIEAALFSAKLDFNTAMGFLDAAKETAVEKGLDYQEKIINLQINQLDVRKTILEEMYQELVEKENYFKKLGADDASTFLSSSLGQGITQGDLEQIYILAFKQSRLGPDIHAGDAGELPFDDKQDVLTAMPVFFVTAVGQGGRHNEGLYGPLPVPTKHGNYSALIYTKLISDENQTDPRMKGKNFVMICILYPHDFETFLSTKRLRIKEVSDNFTANVTDVKEITIDKLKELKKRVFDIEFDPTTAMNE